MQSGRHSSRIQRVGWIVDEILDCTNCRTSQLPLRRRNIFFFSFSALQAESGVDHLVLRFLYPTQLDTHTPSRPPLIQRSDRHRDRYPQNTKYKRRKSMPSAEFEPPIPVIKWLQTCALDFLGLWLLRKKKKTLNQVIFP